MMLIYEPRSKERDKNVIIVVFRPSFRITCCHSEMYKFYAKCFHSWKKNTFRHVDRKTYHLICYPWYDMSCFVASWMSPPYCLGSRPSRGAGLCRHGGRFWSVEKGGFMSSSWRLVLVLWEGRVYVVVMAVGSFFERGRVYVVDSRGAGLCRHGGRFSS